MRRKDISDESEGGRGEGEGAGVSKKTRKINGSQHWNVIKNRTIRRNKDKE